MLNSKSFLKKLLLKALAGKGAGRSEEERWQQDPLSHPVLRRMTPHELADLPFDRF